ncbi:MAG: hypothetical protein VB980_05240 [Opitutales bacterium]
MKMSKKFPFIAILTLLLGSCQSGTVNSTSWQAVGGAGENMEVRANDYDQTFQNRYGLLYHAMADAPYTGRIAILDSADGKHFVSTEEFWYGGRRHGRSTHWSANGQKTWERNYKEGRWHGVVTRWWPNGQKMYVRVYAGGERQNDEMTWRSDGSRFEVGATVAPPVPSGPSSSTPASTEIPEVTDVFTPPKLPAELPSGNIEPVSIDPSPPPIPTIPDGFPPISPANPIVEEPSGFPPVTPSLPELAVPSNPSPALPVETTPPPIDPTSVFGSGDGASSLIDPLAPIDVNPLDPIPADPLPPIDAPAPVDPIPVDPIPVDPLPPIDAPAPVAPPVDLPDELPAPLPVPPSLPNEGGTPIPAPLPLDDLPF